MMHGSGYNIVECACVCGLVLLKSKRYMIDHVLAIDSAMASFGCRRLIHPSDMAALKVCTLLDGRKGRSDYISLDISIFVNFKVFSTWLLIDFDLLFLMKDLVCLQHPIDADLASTSAARHLETAENNCKGRQQAHKLETHSVKTGGIILAFLVCTFRKM